MAKSAPLSSPQKIANEIEAFLPGIPSHTTLTTGTTTSGGDLKLWTPPPEYRFSEALHIAKTESLTDTETELEVELEQELEVEPTSESSTTGESALSDADTAVFVTSDVGAVADTIDLEALSNPYIESCSHCELQ